MPAICSTMLSDPFYQCSTELRGLDGLGRIPLGGGAGSPSLTIRDLDGRLPLRASCYEEHHTIFGTVTMNCAHVSATAATEYPHAVRIDSLVILADECPSALHALVFASF